jgi:hypothetical protein
MFRRLFWMMLGASGALWARQRTLDLAEQYVPAPVRRMIKRTVRGLAEEVVKASSERKHMKQNTFDATARRKDDTD